MPFRTLDCPGEPHPGLRAYPFLGQVDGGGLGDGAGWKGRLRGAGGPAERAKEGGGVVRPRGGGGVGAAPPPARHRRSPPPVVLPTPPGPTHPPVHTQVCKRWQAVLQAPGAQAALWREVVVDFGHELITSVHTPMKWSDCRPSDDEFRAAFATTKLSAAKVVAFVESRARCVRRIMLTNSEGYWSGEEVGWGGVGWDGVGWGGVGGLGTGGTLGAVQLHRT